MVRAQRLLAIVFLLLILPGCNGIFYFPRITKTKFYDPSQVGLRQEEVEFQDQDGTRLHGWWFAAKTPVAKGTIIFFHGNAENLTTHFLYLSWLPAEGYNYFIFDYPGYGVSEGQPNPRGTWLSGLAAIRWVHEKKDPSPLIVFAQSLGGNIGFRCLLDLKNEIPFRALVLDSTFLSYKSLARTKASQSWITWMFQPLVWLLMGDGYAPVKIETRAPVPLLVIHGDEDKVVPVKFGDEIFAKSPEPKEMWRIEQGRHTDVFWSHGRSYRKKFLDYLAAHP